MNQDIFTDYELPASLEPYVRRILVADSAEPVEMTADVRATGYCYLGITLRGRWEGFVNGRHMFDTDLDGKLHLSGQIQDATVTVQFSGPLMQCFVELTPTGQMSLFGVPGQETLESVIPVVRSRLLERLPQDAFDACAKAETGDVLAKAAIVLLEHLAATPYPVASHVVEAVTRAEAANGSIRVDELFADLGPSMSTSRRDFQHVVGLPPKEFCRILMVNTALAWLLADDPPSLAEIAATCGFADQSHMTRAFAAFLGLSPSVSAKEMETTLARFVGDSQRRKVSPKA